MKASMLIYICYCPYDIIGCLRRATTRRAQRRLNDIIDVDAPCADISAEYYLIRFLRHASAERPADSAATTYGTDTDVLVLPSAPPPTASSSAYIPLLYKVISFVHTLILRQDFRHTMGAADTGAAHFTLGCRWPIY